MKLPHLLQQMVAGTALMAGLTAQSDAQSVQHDTDPSGVKALHTYRTPKGTPIRTQDDLSVGDVKEILTGACAGLKGKTITAGVVTVDCDLKSPPPKTSGALNRIKGDMRLDTPMTVTSKGR